MCPFPPALVPQVAPGLDAELADVRAAATDAVAVLLAAAPDRVVVLGSGDLHGDVDESAGGTLAGYGVDVRAGGSSTVLPLSLTIGAWLLDRAGWTGPRTYTTQRPEPVGRVALLVMADLSTRRTPKAPGALDERAEPFDASVAAALAAGDAEALAAIDADLAEELGAAGVPALRLLAETSKGADVIPTLRYDAAPFGVGYVVADWVVREAQA